MRRIAFLSLLCFLPVYTVQAQLTKSQESYLERKVAEAEAKHKKETEAKRRKEQERARQYEQLRRHQDAQVEYLKGVHAGDFMSGPQQQGDSIAKNNLQNEQQNPVAIKRETTSNRQANTYNGRSNFGTPSYSGNDYTNGRYRTNRSTLNNSSLHLRTIPVDKNRNLYTSRNDIRQKPICLRNARKPARILYNNQQQRLTNASQKESQKDPQSPQNKTKSSDNSQSAPQTSITTQMVQAGQTSIKQKVLMKNGLPVFLDDSIHVTTQQNVYSPDLSPISDKTQDDILNGRRIKVDPLNYGTNSLSDEDNKTANMANSNIRSNIQNKSEITEEQLYQLARKDVASGFKSFESPSQWEEIYGREKDRTIKLPAHSISQKRTKK